MKEIAAPKKMRAIQATPYINQSGELVIPTSCERRFHYWDKNFKERMSLVQVLEYAGADEKTKQKYWNPYAKHMIAKIETDEQLITNDEEE